MLRLLGQTLAILLAAAALGLGVNALRSDDSLELGRAYFGEAAPLPGPAPVQPPADGSQPAGPQPPSAKALNLAARAAEEFTLVDASLVQRLRRAADLDPRGSVLIDARDDSHFTKDHVPGALQLDPFNLRRDIAPHQVFLQDLLIGPPMQAIPQPMPGPHPTFDGWIGAPRPLLPMLVVYCESDECEDGFNLCRALRDEYGIDRRRIVLFLGGMREWRQHRLPVARGGELW